MSPTNCPSCQATLIADAKFCSNCGNKVESVDPKSDGQQTPYAERKQLTVLFSDLAGSTQLSEILDPEDMREILSDYQSVCTAIIKRYGGYVAKFLGDGVLAYFGYPEAHEDDPRRGVSAGLGIIEAMKSYSEKFQKKFGVETDVRVGLHTGLVVIGDMGGSEELESDAVVGKTPNLAARVQSEAELNTVCVSDDTYKLLGSFFECKDLGSRELKGIAEPVKLYQAIHERTGATRLDVSSGKLTPFTGRKSEMESLKDKWGKAIDGNSHIVVVNGEAGIGKSRVVHAMKEFIATQKNAWLTEVRCSQYYVNSSFYPIIDMIERVVLNFTPDENPEEKLEKIEGWTAQFGLDDTIVPLFASLLSVPLSANHAPLNLTPVKQKEKTMDLLISILLRRSQEQPVLFVVEDLHWADPSTLELLEKFIDRSEGSNILSIFTHRPQFKHEWEKKENVSTMDLARFVQDESEEIILKVTNGKKVPEEATQYILEKTDGIPLFLEELTNMMVETEMFKEADGNYVLTSALDKLPVPNTLNDLLAARLDRMKEAKPVAQLAATIGREFSYSMIDSIPGNHRNDLETNLSKLVDAGLLYKKSATPDTEYVFKHALIQDSAYESLLKSSRRDFHKAIAGSFVESRPEVLEAQPELIAHHYTQAESPAEAMGYWQKAGQLAIQKSAMPEAISHLKKAVSESAKLPEGPERLGGELMAQTYLGLANMQAWGYGHPDVETAFTRARDLCKIMGDPPQIFPVLHGLVKFRLVRGEFVVGLELARQLQATAEETGDTNLLIEALYVVGAAQFWMGDPDASFPSFAQLLSLYDPVAHKDHAMIYGEDPCVVALSHNLWQRAVCGMFNESDVEQARAEELVDQLQHPWSTDYLHVCRTQKNAILRDYEKTEEYAIQFRDSALEHGFPWWVAASLINLGWAIAHRGEVEKGLEMAKENVELWRMMGAELAAPHFYLRIAEIHLLDGNPAEALKALEESLSIIKKTREGLYEADVIRTKGITLGLLDRKEEGLEAVSKAIEIAADRNQPLWHLKALTSHVELSQKLNKEQPMLPALEEVYNSFTEGHELRDLQHAKKLLNELKEVSS